MTSGADRCLSLLFAASNQRTASASATAAGEIELPNQRPFLHSLFSNRAVLAQNRRGNVFGCAEQSVKITQPMICVCN